jgi:hypothetical protein
MDGTKQSPSIAGNLNFGEDRVEDLRADTIHRRPRRADTRAVVWQRAGGVTGWSRFTLLSCRLIELPAAHTLPDSDPEVPSRQVGGKRLRQRPQQHHAAGLICVSRYTSTARRADAHPLAYPNSAQATSGAGGCWCVVARARGASGAGKPKNPNPPAQ